MRTIVLGTLLTMALLASGCSYEAKPSKQPPSQSEKANPTPATTASPSPESKTAAALYAKLLTAAGAEDQEKIAGVEKWQDEHSIKPIIAMVSEITPELTEKTLGKPDNVEEDVVHHGLYDTQGEPFHGPVYWYGDVGLGFTSTKVDDTPTVFLALIKCAKCE